MRELEAADVASLETIGVETLGRILDRKPRRSRDRDEVLVERGDRHRAAILPQGCETGKVECRDSLTCRG